MKGCWADGVQWEITGHNLALRCDRYWSRRGIGSDESIGCDGGRW